MFPHHNNIDHPAQPFSDEEARAQVIDLARQIAQLNNLPSLAAGLYFQSCNDQGDPPFQAILEMNFRLPTDTSTSDPAGVDANTYYDQIAKTMVAHGWTDGPLPGLHPAGTVIHNNAVMATIMSGPNAGWNKIRLDGECRDMTDHRNDPTGWVDVTEQVTK
jgi:hypothetical protein